MEIVAADIGGTHARFALAQLGDGRVQLLSEPLILRTAEHADLPAAWDAFARHCGRPLPPRSSIAIAAPVRSAVMRLTNNSWSIDPRTLAQTLRLECCHLINDFGAVGHAVTLLDASQLQWLCGPREPLPERGVISIIGPGSGLGVALILRSASGYEVVECEGGHTGFAPCDEIDDAVLDLLRRQHARVSAERVLSGAGLMAIYRVIAERAGRNPVAAIDERALWQSALSGDDALAQGAAAHFCRCLGRVAGDIALVHGAGAVVMAGGLGRRLAQILPHSEFAGAFAAKGRMKAKLERVPVQIILHPEPGLYGAAAAFAKEHGQ